MRLEIGSFHVREVVFSDSTRYVDGILYVDRDAVVRLVREDPRFDSADLHLVRPGDSTRLTNVIDVVEPRHKVSGPGGVFPGLLGPPVTVGRGRTHRLANLALVETSEPAFREPTYWRDSILDMSGPGAQYNQFAGLLNLVLELRPRAQFTSEDLARLELTNYNRGSQWVQDYHRGVRVAALKVASYLAETTRDLSPEDVVPYELSPADPSLPRVVYSCQIHHHLVYGQPLGWQPTFIHPNELMDGAIIDPHNPPAGTRGATYVHQNHPIIKRLYDSHGNDLTFCGILLYRAQIQDLVDKGRTTCYGAKLLGMLGVQGVIMTYTGGGNPGMDIMMLAQECEKVGIKATILNCEMSGREGDSGFVDYVPEADAIVNLGNFEESVSLPPVSLVIGGDRISDPELDASGELRLPLRYLYGSTDILGASKLGGVQY